jgi:hypothetical protein
VCKNKERMADVKIPLLGKTLSEIQGIVHGLGMPGFTANGYTIRKSFQ